MRALVTGACGFVGPHLITELREFGDEVAAIVRVSGSQLGCSTYQLDLLDTDALRRVLQMVRPDVIYHLAGMSFVPEAEKSLEGALKGNVLLVDSVLKAARLECPHARIVVVSSGEVYGQVDPASGAVTEESQPAPQNNYSLSKLMAEMTAAKAGREGANVAIARPFNHIGPGQDPRFVSASFARQLALIQCKGVEPIIRVGNLDVERDFTDVRDIVRGYRAIAEKGSGVFNLCSGVPIQIRRLLDLLIEISGLEVHVEVDPRYARPSDNPRVFGSYAKANRELGWQPRVELRDSLVEVYEYWLDVIA